MSPGNLRVLLENGVDVSFTNGEGIPTLVAVATHAWSRGRSLDASGWLYKFRLLLGCPGVDVNVADPDGETALSVLSRSCYSDVVSLMLSRGSDVFSCDKSHLNTCLHWAAKYGRVQVLRVLLKSAPSLADCRNAKGQVPLDLAKLFAHAEVELELLRLKKHKK